MGEMAEKEVTVTRTINAPRRRVFRAWTDAGELAEWWHPIGFTTAVSELDDQPGGAFRLDMHGPDGTVFPMEAVFTEVEEPERLVFITTRIMEGEGPEPQLEVVTTVTLAEQDGKTEMKVHEVVLKSTPLVQQALAGMEEGLKQTLDRLVEYLE
jgi:uncharacterized protein YndB with AHSA1/START domain